MRLTRKIRTRVARLRLRMLCAVCERVTSRMLVPLWALTAWEKVPEPKSLAETIPRASIRKRISKGMDISMVLEKDPTTAAMAMEDLQLQARNLRRMVR